MRSLTLSSLFLLTYATTARAQSVTVRIDTSEIRTAELRASLRFLSSDLLEGRGTGARGGRVAEAYVASQLEAFGLRPAFGDTSFFQEVPVDIARVDEKSVRVEITIGDRRVLLADTSAVVIPATLPSVRASGPVVFVGYGIVARTYRWDDYKAADVRGKWVMALFGEPPPTAAEPALFGGKATTSYSWPDHKLAQARAHGALGVILVTPDSMWQLARMYGSLPRTTLHGDAPAPSLVGLRPSDAASLLTDPRRTIDRLATDATRREFQPAPMDANFSASYSATIESRVGRNVAGIVPGTDPRMRSTAVAVTAHLDHLGIGPAVAGDSIYNGALDDGSGVVTVLAMAKSAAARPATARSLLFLLTTGEEAGMLGSAWFVEHPPIACDKIVADVNIDGGNLTGPARDLDVIGAEKTTLGSMLERFAATRGLRASTHADVEGFYSRSDQFSFARAGIPAIFPGAGENIIGKAKGWGVKRDSVFGTRYHQPSDEFDPTFDFVAAAQFAQVMLGYVRAIGNAKDTPRWTNAHRSFDFDLSCVGHR